MSFWAYWHPSAYSLLLVYSCESRIFSIDAVQSVPVVLINGLFLIATNGNLLLLFFYWTVLHSTFVLHKFNYRICSIRRSVDSRVLHDLKEAVFKFVKILIYGSWVFSCKFYWIVRAIRGLTFDTRLIQSVYGRKSVIVRGWDNDSRIECLVECTFYGNAKCTDRK